ncbi:MAG TPA: ATPase, T2SS/T4P/T4SS family, partial [Gemmatimonadales bacterium]|nr:ATPase, T2SS/T4P/T4SS family [Gemmatimonadales bacterium]
MAETFFPDEWLLQSLEGLLTPERLAELRSKAESGRTLWETLVSQKVATDEVILEKLSARYRLKIATLAQVDPTIRDRVPEQLVRRFRVAPIRMTDSFLEVATSNPFDLDAEKAMAFAMTREIRPLLAAPSQIATKLDELYRPEKALDRLLEGMAEPDLVTLTDAAPAEDINITATEAEASQRPVVKLVDLIISEGILSRSSDIHIEPEEGGVAVRYRIDGVLRQVMKIPRAAGVPLISRIKIMSSLDIADRLRPQDGRARVSVNGQPIDLRVSTLPA